MLHLDIGLAGSGRIHRIVLILHFDIDAVYVRIPLNLVAGIGTIDDIPPTFCAVLRYMTGLQVVEEALMEVTNLVIVRLIALPKNLIRDKGLPVAAIYCLIENHFDRVDDVLIKSFDIITAVYSF